MRYRTAAIFAGFGLAAALVAGLAGGVPFATVVLRALAGAAVFGALGLATLVVLERFVPELLARVQAQQSAPAEAPPPAIDILLPEENPLAAEIGSALEPADESGAESLEAVAADPAGSRELPGELPVPDAEPAPPAMAEPIADDAAALPSLDELDSGSDHPQVGRADATRSAATGTVGTNTDPSLAARALRTWLKRDHEG